MKIFTNKKAVQKVIIAVLIVLSFNFIMPNYAKADFGGVLMGPIIDFLSGVGDMVLSALQYWMYDGEISLGSAVGGAAGSVLTLINPFDTFLLKRNADNFESTLSKYDMNGSGGDVDIEVDSENFDKGWFGSLFGIAEKAYGVPIIKYTPEAIFGNKVPALDINFINPKQWESESQNEHSITQVLHETIASWYIALRNLALIILLSVLLYVAIRMIISSTASDKAKYKQMLIDWIVAVCILFFLHYVMSFILSVTEIVTDGVNSSSAIVVRVIDNDNGSFNLKTDLTGLVRLQVQYKDLGARLIYLIFYIALVIYTAMFTWTYVKRAITMAFLTLMAPLISITYPIDKIGDGQAQAFSVWLREYIFNALLQPFHLIIYSIFMGAASDIAVKNPIYAILFLAFIIPAEKLLRKMFGFDKSNTAGALNTAAGIFGGAAAFKAVSGLISKGSNAGKGSKSGGGSGIRTKKPIEKKTPSAIEAFGTTRSLDSGSGSVADSSAPMSSSGVNKGAIDRAFEDNRDRQSSRSSEYERRRNVEDTTIGAGSGYLTDSGIWLPNSTRLNTTAQQGPVSQATQQRRERLQELQQANQQAAQRAAQQMQAQQLQQLQQEQQAQQTPYQSPQSTRLQDNGPEVNVPETNLWAGNDARGLGTYIKDELGTKLYENSTAYRTISDGQRTIRQMAEEKRMQASFINKIPKPIRNTAKGTLAVAGRLGKAGVRAAGVATMAGIGATIGLAAGIAGDDLEDVLKYGAAGVALGATGLPALGSGVARGVVNTVSSYAETYRSAAYGPDQAVMMQQTKQWLESAENKADMTQTYMDINNGKRPSTAELNKIMKTGVEYYNSGITENKDIKKGIKLEKEVKEQLSSQGMEEEDANKLARMQAIYVAKEASKYTKSDLRDDKKVEGLRKDISKQLVNGGMQASDANKQSVHMVNMIKRFRGVATD